MVDKISLPVVIPGRLLISPGIWNGDEYTAKEIGEGFARTDWADKEKISLWLNHDDRNTAAFVGYVKNPTLASEGRVFGDLEIWDEKVAINLTQAMAKFGVSAKIKGEEDEKGKMKNFTFENFSVVTIPACSEAYINLSKKEDDKLTSKYLISKLNLKPIERRLKENMDEEEKKEEEVVEEKSEEVKENSKELSSKIDELSSKFDKLISLLSKKLEEEEKSEEKEEAKEEEKPEVEKENEEDESTIDPEGDKLLPKAEDKNDEPAEEVVKENKELTAVKKELAEIKEKLNAPKSKTVRNLSSNTVGEKAEFDENQFCELLGTVESPMKFK